jgi:hypothetical protein
MNLIQNVPTKELGVSIVAFILSAVLRSLGPHRSIISVRPQCRYPPDCQHGENECQGSPENHSRSAANPARHGGDIHLAEGVGAVGSQRMSGASTPPRA